MCFPTQYNYFTLLSPFPKSPITIVHRVFTSGAGAGIGSEISNVCATYLVCDSSKPCQGEFSWGEQGVETMFRNVLVPKSL